MCHPPRPLRSAALLLFLAASSLLLGCADAAKKERIVLVTLDTLRYDSFTGAKGQATTMPRTHAFMKRGENFERFYSSSATTQPSHASLFTGLHPWQHGVVRNGTMLKQKHATLAEVLKQAGFGTAAVVSSFAVHSRFGYGQGFDSFDDNFEVSLPSGQSKWMGKELEGAFYSMANDVTERAVSAMEGIQSDRQFLWVHYYDPHTPYGDSLDKSVELATVRAAIAQRPKQRDKAIAYGKDLYDKDVRYLDRALERLLKRLELDAEEYETHIVIVSDHGESFGESNSLGHGNRLTPEQIHVPLAILSPLGQQGAGARRQDIAGMVDLYTTILGMAGLPTPPVARGRDLRQTTEGSAYGMRRIPVKGGAREVRADGSVLLIEGPRFFIVNSDVIHSGDSSLVLEDDERDPGLTPERTEELQSLFSVFQAELEGEDVDALEDEETLELLRAMGYME